MSEEKGEAVKLYVYDLSNGLARQLSLSLLGKQIDGVWHSAIVVNGREFYFGGGIQEVTAGHSPFGRPLQVVNLGETFVPDEIRREFISDLRNKYSEATYDLFNNNCNNFADDLANLLVGRGIPDHITSLPQEVLATPFGKMLAPMLSRTIGDQLGHVQSGPAAAAPRSTAAAGQQASTANPVEGVSDAIRSAAAVAAADTGVPLTGPPTQSAGQAAQSGPKLAPEGARELSSAHQSLSNRPEAAAQLAKADQPPLSNPSVNAHAASPASDTGKAASSGTDRAAFEAALKAEFARIMAAGNVTPNEAAAQAMRTVTSRRQA